MRPDSLSGVALVGFMSGEPIAAGIWFGELS
jgi:hypothetical protein